jgi:hypothetical protein
MARALVTGARVAIEHDGDLYLLGLCAKAPMASRRRLALRHSPPAISAIPRPIDMPKL